MEIKQVRTDFERGIPALDPSTFCVSATCSLAVYIFNLLKVILSLKLAWQYY